jgi:hypothetical protein
VLSTDDPPLLRYQHPDIRSHTLNYLVIKSQEPHWATTITVRAVERRENVKHQPHDVGGRWPERLVEAIERAAEAGWPQTARMIALLAVAAAAVALIVVISR